jgi:hypothetical protein
MFFSSFFSCRTAHGETGGFQVYRLVGARRHMPPRRTNGTYGDDNDVDDADDHDDDMPRGISK